MKINVEKIDSFTGHRDSVYTLAAFNEDSQFFSAAGDGMIVRWDITKPDWGEPIAQVKNSVYSLCYDATRNWLWIGQNFEGIHIIDPTNKKSIGSIKLNASAIFDIKIDRNIAYIATGDGVISILDIDTLSFRKHLKASEKSVRCLAINPLTNEFAAGYSDHTIKIFDLQTLELKQILEGHKNSVFSIAYTPDYKKLLSTGRDAKIRVWDVSNQYENLFEIAAHLFAINHITFSPDGNYFATCSMDKTIKIWSSNTFKLLKVIDKARHAGHGTSVNKILWANLGNYILSCSDDRTISVWKLH